MGFYPSHVLINDGKRHGLRILPPDINLSGIRCRVEGGNGIRIGLGYVQAMGAEAAQRHRARAGVERPVPLAGRFRAARAALDRSGGEPDRGRRVRRASGWAGARRSGSSASSSPRAASASSRGGPGQTPSDPTALLCRSSRIWRTPADGRLGPDGSRLRRARALAALPPARPAAHTAAGRLVTTAGPRPACRTAPLTIAGLIVCRQRPGTAKGIHSCLLEDELGLANVIVYPTLSGLRLLVRAEPFLLIEGTMQRSDRNINIIATRFHRLAEVIEALSARRTLRPKSPSRRPKKAAQYRAEPPQMTSSWKCFPRSRTATVRRANARIPATREDHHGT